MTEKENFAENLEQFVTGLKNYVSTDDGQWTVISESLFLRKDFLGVLPENPQKRRDG